MRKISKIVLLYKLKRSRELWHRKGGVMAYVLIIFLVIGILAASMAGIFNANLKQTKSQQDAMEAYYLAYSGALIAHEALLANGGAKLNEITVNNQVLTSGSMDLGRGTVSVVAEQSSDSNLNGWVKITATSVLDRNNHTTIRILYFDPANPLEMLWSGK